MYHLYKQTRIYDGHPYWGPTNNKIPAQYETLKKAKQAQTEFNKHNPIDWNIYDEETGRLVNNINMHDKNKF